MVPKEEKEFRRNAPGALVSTGLLTVRDVSRTYEWRISMFTHTCRKKAVLDPLSDEERRYDWYEA